MEQLQETDETCNETGNDNTDLAGEANNNSYPEFPAKIPTHHSISTRIGGWIANLFSWYKY